MAQNSFKKLQELDLTNDEIETIGTALKNEEFRKLFSDYVEEIQDPDNRRIYEKEIVELEKERGVEATFIHPKPGYVIKTSIDGSQKAFINICSNSHIEKPSSSADVKDGVKGLQWSLPHSISPPREDVDNKGVACQVYDVVFHPKTLHLADKNAQFRNIVNATAYDAVEDNFDVKLDRKNVKFPKLQYKGVQRASIIRKPSGTKPAERTAEEKEFYDKLFADVKKQEQCFSKRKPKKTQKPTGFHDKSSYTTPKYIIKHRNHIDIQDFTECKDGKLNAAIPKELIVEVNLPLLKSSSDIILDVTEKTVQLTSEKPAKYKLNITLPYSVIECNGNAKFDKDQKKLIIALPVKRTTKVLDTGRDDSGVDSDHCHPSTPESEEDGVQMSDNESKISVYSECDIKPSENLNKIMSHLKTKFLDDDLHYTLPEFTCHVFENLMAFTLNVKNVDENSIGKMIDDAGTSIHIKFTSISSSFYPSHYAFCVKLPMHIIDPDNTNIETWDNNVILQLAFNVSDHELKSYLYGINGGNLTEKYVEEPAILHQVLLDEPEQKPAEEPTNHTQIKKNKKEKLNRSLSESSVELEHNCRKNEQQPQKNSHAINIHGTSYESSGDELSLSYSPSKSKGILKRFSSRSVPRSISESSLDDFVASSYENVSNSLETAIPENGEVSTSLKKTVRFNDAIVRQMFR